MDTTENQRTKLTKRLFKEAMIDLLKKKTLYDITVTELCQKAELNRSTFYKYYENTHDVFVDIENELLKKSNEVIYNIDITENNNIIKHLYKLLCYMKEKKNTYQVLLNNNISEKFVINMMKQTTDSLKNKINGSNINLGKPTDYTFTYIITGSSEIIRKWINNDTKESPEYIAELIYNLAASILGFDKVE